MKQSANLTKMWDESLRNLESSEPVKIKIEYLNLESRQEQGVCGHFAMEYISNRHPERDIRATVRTTSWYMGNIVHEESKQVIVPAGGSANAVRLGCTGWQNPTGANHTEYRRNIDYAEWA